MLWYGASDIDKKNSAPYYSSELCAGNPDVLPSTLAFEPISLLPNPQQLYSGMLEGCEACLSIGLPEILVPRFWDVSKCFKMK